MCVHVCVSIFVESTYSKANAPQPHEILVKSESVTYTTDSVVSLRVHSTDIGKVISCLQWSESYHWLVSVIVRTLDLQLRSLQVGLPATLLSGNDSGLVVHIDLPLSPSNIIWH